MILATIWIRVLRKLEATLIQVSRKLEMLSIQVLNQFRKCLGGKCGIKI